MKFKFIFHNSFNTVLPERAISNGSILGMIVVMTFIASLSIFSMQQIKSYFDEWYLGIDDEITVELPNIQGLPHDERLELTEETIENFGVKTFRVLSDDQIFNLISPWINAEEVENDLASFPLPKLIAVKLDSYSDVENFRNELNLKVPEAKVDEHFEWKNIISKSVRVFIFIGYLITVLILILCSLSIVFSTHSSMRSLKDTMAVLHYAGADDDYIAMLLARQHFMLCLKGAVIGVVAFIIFNLFISTYYDGLLDENSLSLFSNHDNSLLMVVLFFLIPSFMSFLSAITSYYAAIFLLNRLNKS